ncbi:hypothetical protein MASR2M8_01010 [Opitutaceae bacterium]
MRVRLDFIGQHAEVWGLELAGHPAKVLFLPRTNPLPDEPSLGMDHFIQSRGLTEQIVGTVYPDRRSTGYGLSRFRDNARLDFTQIATDPRSTSPTPAVSSPRPRPPTWPCSRR